MKIASCGIRPVLLFSILLLSTQTSCKKQEPAAEKPDQTEKPTPHAPLQSAQELTFPLEEVNTAEIDVSKHPLPALRNLEKFFRAPVSIGGEEFTAYFTEQTFEVRERSVKQSLVYLISEDYAPSQRPLYWRMNDPRQTYQQIAGVLYTCSIKEDRSAVVFTPCQGRTGWLQISCGDRAVNDVNIIRCYLRSKDSMLMLTESSENSFSVPAGDYDYASVSVDFDTLRVSILNNRYMDAGQTEPSEEKPLQVGEGQVLTFDFSAKPEVFFTKITDGMEFKPGDEIKMAAVLVDTKLNMMVSRLYDNSKMVTKELKDRNGNVVRTYEVMKTLEPTVQITRADGTLTAEGKMPFG